MTDIITAMRRYVVDGLGPQPCPSHTHPPVTSGRASRPYALTDHFGFDSTTGIWIFQERLLARVEGSSNASPVAQTMPVALVLSHRGSWTVPNEHNTMSFPRLATTFFADPVRDDGGNVIDPLSARDQIQAAHEALDFHLHRFHFTGAKIIGATDTDPGLRLVRCTRLGELVFSVVPEGDGVLSAQVFYALGVG